ncbi:baseplate J/gp47 family protein [Sphaerisporangium corydalis]|uniref:Baseplate protein J-like domain-containing protein n=1 Tax=Sphaerisporangium corydalis TaxID=1441875 RepID=A0ABV9E6L0_9ACTN|nr:hypothetical protein [Sphaerisporangium corydalis]
MPIPLPNLDDHTFADLVAEARALIPVLAPGWTDHNPGDPGIALVEMLAWLTETAMFQVDQVTPAHTERFLGLLNGPPPEGSPPEASSLEERVRATTRALREPYRAATPGDFERLVLGGTGTALGQEIVRARCVPGRDLSAADPDVRAAEAPGHVSVVAVPGPPGPGPYPRPVLDPAVAAALWDFLDGRRLLTTRHHVVGPAYVRIEVEAVVALGADAPPQEAFDDMLDRLRTFLGPLTGGTAKDGWPFGRDVYASEIYTLLDRSPFTDYVDAVVLRGGTPIPGREGEVAGIALDDHELAELTRVHLTCHQASRVAFEDEWRAGS